MLDETVKLAESILAKTIDTTDITASVGSANLVAAQDLDPVIKELGFRETPFFEKVRKEVGSGAGFSFNTMAAMSGSTINLRNAVYTEGGSPTETDTSYASKYVAFKSLGWKGGVTGLAQSTGESIVNLYSEEVRVKTKQLIDALEFFAFWGATGNAGEFDGLDALITTNVIDAAGVVISKELIDRAALRIQAKGGYATHIFASPRVQADINNIYNSTNQVIVNMAGAQNLTLGQTVSQAQTAVGLLPIIGDFFLNPGNTYTLPNGSSSTPLGATTSTVFILNMDYISYKFLQTPVVEDLGKVGDKREFFVKTYAALKLTAEPWCAKIINVKDNTLT